MNTANYAWIMAGMAGITAAWQQIRSFLSRFISYFWVSLSVDKDVGVPLIAYLYEHLKFSPFGQNFYTGSRHFIRPKDRYGIVAFRSVSRSMTFYSKFFSPVFVSLSGDKDLGFMTVSFFRGTYNIEKILIEAVETWNSQIDRQESVKGSGRYMVRRFLGKRKYRTDDKEASPKGMAVDGPGVQAIIPLGWKTEDLVAPTNDSPFSALFYPEEVKDFIDQVRKWFKSESWYKERGIQWRFGGLFYGPPGTGKTSCARAIAQELGIPIMILDLTTMDNQDLNDSWSEVVSHSPCIVLLEDLDRVYHEHEQTKDSDFPQVGPSLDCLLNCISGVEPANGILTIASANDVTKLDPALGIPDKSGKSTRPGRLDVCVYFGKIDEQGRRSIAGRILPLINHDGNISYTPADFLERLVAEGDGETGAQFTKRVADKALELYWKKAA